MIKNEKLTTFLNKIKFIVFILRYNQSMQRVPKMIVYIS